MQEITGPVVAVGDGDEERGDPVPTDTDDDPGSRSHSQRPRRAERAFAGGGEVSAQQLLLQAGSGRDLEGFDGSFVIIPLMTNNAAPLCCQ